MACRRPSSPTEVLHQPADGWLPQLSGQTAADPGGRGAPRRTAWQVNADPDTRRTIGLVPRRESLLAGLEQGGVARGRAYRRVLAALILVVCP